MTGPNGTDGAGACPPWYALQVETNRERRVREALRLHAIDEFLPIYRQASRWSDRTKTIERPLFPGYLFARLDPHFPLPVLRGLIRVVGWGCEPAPVEEREIERVRRIVAAPYPIEPWPLPAVGQLVEIVRGPLEGYEGTVLRLKGVIRIVLSIETLRRAVAVTLGLDQVRPLPARKTA